ncbi:MAG TPA: hypothetical protein VGB68_14100 [Pyrinomonadaceae bacterium]
MSGRDVSVCDEHDLQPVNKAFTPDRRLPSPATARASNYRFHRR